MSTSSSAMEADALEQGILNCMKDGIAFSTITTGKHPKIQVMVLIFVNLTQILHSIVLTHK